MLIPLPPQLADNRATHRAAFLVCTVFVHPTPPNTHLHTPLVQRNAPLWLDRHIPHPPLTQGLLPKWGVLFSLIPQRGCTDHVNSRQQCVLLMLRISESGGWVSIHRRSDIGIACSMCLLLGQASMFLSIPYYWVVSYPRGFLPARQVFTARVSAPVSDAWHEQRCTRLELPGDLLVRL